MDFQTFGEALVKVDISGITNELGYCYEPIKIQPSFAYKDMLSDDFPTVPSNRLWMLAETKITMTLVYYNPDILQDCILAAMGGGTDGGGILQMAAAGTPMGIGSVGDENNALVALTISSVNGLEEPYMFPACHLIERPVEIPVGVERSLVQLVWSSLPYNGNYPGTATDLSSALSVLWRRSPA